MREIVHLQIGKAGNAAGTKFWEAICEEHGIDPDGSSSAGCSQDQLEKINSFFHLNRRRRFVPRAVIVDLDAESVADARSSRYGRLFKAGNLLSGGGSASNNWAKGFYTEGRMLAPAVLDSTRREAEKCDCLQGLQIVHSIAGGTGSGLGSLLLRHLADEYPGRSLNTYTIIPSPNIFDDRTQTYNAVLALHYLTEMTVETYCLDNTALSRICENSLGMPKAGFENLNYLISTAMAAVTTTIRLPGRLNDGPIKGSVNMVPFPRLHYITPGFAPMLNEGQHPERPLSVPELCDELADPKNMFIYPSSDGKYLTASYIFRGGITVPEVRSRTSQFFKKNCQSYVDWIPDNVKTEVCPVPLRGWKTSAASAGNTTGVRVTFERVLELFGGIHERRLYTRWFTDEGVHEEELDEAGMSLREVAEEYEKCERAMYDDVWHDVNADWGGQL